MLASMYNLISIVGNSDLARLFLLVVLQCDRNSLVWVRTSRGRIQNESYVAHIKCCFLKNPKCVEVFCRWAGPRVDS